MKKMHRSRQSPAPAVLVEVPDAAGRLLYVTPLAEALKQKLPFHLAASALFGEREKEKILYLLRNTNPLLGPVGAWDLLTAPVPARASVEDAAEGQVLAVSGLNTPVEFLKMIPGTPEHPAHMTLFSARVPKGLRPAPAELLELDADELAGLAQGEPDLLAPTLLRAVAAGIPGFSGGSAPSPPAGD